MPLLHVVVLAFVQAATEFLPVSSTAHLVLVPWLLGWPAHPLLFDIALHAGTLAAVLLYFAKTWIRLLGLAVGRPILLPNPGEPDHDLYENPRLFAFLVAATLPAGIAGLALEDLVKTTLRSPAVIGVMLIAIALLLAYAEKTGSFKRDLGRVSLRDAMLIGCSQAVALIPGTSRSGITMSSAMLLGLTRSSAARFSFLLSSPIILGAAARASLEIWGQGGIPPDEQTAFIVGVLCSAVFGYAVIAFFLRFLQRSTLLVFIYYRIIFGIIVLALAVLSRLPAGA